MAALALVAVLATPARAQDKLDLRLRLKKGDVYRLKLTVEQHVVQTPPAPPSAGHKRTAPAAPQSIEQTLGVGYTMSVEDADAAGVMTVATKYDSVRFRQKGPAGNVEYDSADPPKQLPPSAKAFAALPGLGFKMILAPEGEVKSVEGIDEMLAEMLRRLDVADASARAATQKVLAEQFGEAAMKQNMQNLFALYPPKPAGVGETWARKVVVSKGFPVVIDATYALKARQGGVAEVALDAKLSPNSDAAPVELGTGKMTYELSGEQRGSAKVVEATGWTQSLTTEQTLSGTIKFDTLGDKDTTIPITVKSKVVMEARGNAE
jgi:hypothetical protein